MRKTVYLRKILERVSNPKVVKEYDQLATKNKGSATAFAVRQIDGWLEGQCYNPYLLEDKRTVPDTVQSLFKRTKCVVCLSQLSSESFTCSTSCAGKLAASKRYFKSLQNRYGSTEKYVDMQGIVLQIFKYFPFGYNPDTFNLNILQFYGGGVFYELLDDHLIDRTFTITSVDMDRRIAPILNSIHCPPHHYTISQKKLLDALNDKQHSKQFSHTFDIVYLDYCGPWTEDKLEDIKRLFEVNRSSSYSLFFITLNRSREFFKGESKVFVKDYEHVLAAQINNALENFGSSRFIYKHQYTHNTSKMVTLGFIRGRSKNIQLPDGTLDHSFPNLKEKRRFQEYESVVYAV